MSMCEREAPAPWPIFSYVFSSPGPALCKLGQPGVLFVLPEVLTPVFRLFFVLYSRAFHLLVFQPPSFWTPFSYSNYLTFPLVKINKQKSHLKWRWEARTQSSQALPLEVNCRANRMKCLFVFPAGKTLLLYYPVRGRKNFTLPCNNPTNERITKPSQ